jgi:hypothetical protein
MKQIKVLPEAGKDACGVSFETVLKAFREMRVKSGRPVPGILSGLHKPGRELLSLS